MTVAFNRTAYGIEILSQGEVSYRYGTFNRTAYGIEIRMRVKRMEG